MGFLYEKINMIRLVQKKSLYNFVRRVSCAVE